MIYNVLFKLKYLFNWKRETRHPFIFKITKKIYKGIKKEYTFKFYISKVTYPQKELTLYEKEVNFNTIKNMVKLFGLRQTKDNFFSKRFLYRLLKENHASLKHYKRMREVIDYYGYYTIPPTATEKMLINYLNNLISIIDANKKDK